jgi:hypothetical protein
MGIVFLIVAGLALIPAYLARSKGRDFLLWWLFGVVTLPVAFVAALIIEEWRPCPTCGSKNRISASFCGSCGEAMPTRTPARQPSIDSMGMTPMQREVLRQRQQRRS